MEMQTEGKMLRVKETAKRWGVSERTVWRELAARELTKVKVRNCTCIPEADVLAYEERTRRGGV